MKTFLVAALVVSSVWGSTLIQRPGTRIIGGREANAGEFPFSAAIYKQTSDGQYFCGGALLNSEWILTAGSCVNGATLFSIRLGTSDLNSNGAEVVRLTTDTYFAHPDYNPDTLENDIALIRLRLPVSFTDYIQPIGIPARDVNPYALVFAIGWGQLSDEEAGLTNDLHTVELTALSNEECLLYFGSQINDNMVCVDGNYNQGTCLGDTGGPLIQYVNVHRATIVGVSSFISGKGCESTDPSGFTRTFPYLEWIANITQSTF